MTADLGDYQIHDDVRDAPLTELKNNVTKLVLCDAAPANYTDANTLNGVSTGVKIAEVTVTSTDFTIADATPDGRKVTVGAESAVPVVAAGDGTHVAWLDVTNSKVLFCTLLAAARNTLTTSDTVDIPAHFCRVRDAVVAS